MALTNPRRVVVDNTDQRILYSSTGWFLDNNRSLSAFGNSGSTHQHTLHGTKVNSSLSFSFQGTQVTVMGIYDPVSRQLDTGNQPYTCWVDSYSYINNVTPGYNENTVNDLELCSIRGLDDGPHELRLSITVRAGQTFWIDEIQYSPSPSLPPEPGVVLRIDNTDPEIIYNSEWGPLKSNGGVPITYGSGSVKFSFMGTGLSWIGIIPTEVPHVPSQGRYSIDGGPLISFRLKGLPPDKDIALYNQVFFSTGNLTADRHTLQVTYDGDFTQTALTLDYLYITTNPTPTTIMSTTVTGPRTSTSINTSSGVHSQSTHGRPVGAIAGGVISGTAFIILTFALFFWYRRKYHYAWHSNTKPEVTPYSYDTVDTGLQPVVAGHLNLMPGANASRKIDTQPPPTEPLSVERSAPTPLSASSLPPSRPQEDAPPSYTTSISR